LDYKVVCDSGSFSERDFDLRVEYKEWALSTVTDGYISVANTQPPAWEIRVSNASVAIQGQPPPPKAQSHLYSDVCNKLVALNNFELNAIAVVRVKEVRMVQETLQKCRINSNILERMIAILYNYYREAGWLERTPEQREGGEILFEIAKEYEAFAFEHGLKFDAGDMRWQRNGNWKV
jgi:hypothetical protein